MTDSAFANSISNEAQDIQCPRCGYDLRGAVATWQQQCPLSGTCTECGLGFDWAAVIVPWKFEPTWCVEFVSPARRIPSAALRTFLRSLRPIKFWRAQDMSHHVRWRRLLAYAGILLILMLSAFVFEHTVVATRAYFVVKDQLLHGYSSIQASISYLQSELTRLQNGEGDESAEVRAQQLAVYQQRIQSQRTYATTITTMPISLGTAIFDALARPLAQTPLSNAIFLTGASYPAPTELYTTIEMDVNNRSGQSVGAISNGPMFAVAFGVWAGWSSWLFMPIGFVLLPVTRRRAKVRWAHIGRVFAYSLWIPAFGFISMLALLALAYGTMVWMNTLIYAAFLMVSVFVLGAGIAWWRAAIRHYMHVPHAWAVVVLLSVMATLIPPVIILAMTGFLFG